ncbi:MAG TPA: EAL domain-containing protein [Acidimicrobiales bacterium]
MRSSALTTAPRTPAPRLELLELLEYGEPELHYQPVVELLSGRVIGAEALLRWRYGDEIVPPSVIVPLAEQMGVINEIGAWVVEEACRQLASWHRSANGTTFPSVSVNVSPTQLHGSGLATTITRALATAGLQPHHLAIELTEDIPIVGVHAAAVVAEIADLGVTVALDDLGVGHSSLRLLSQMPIHVVKLDRQFVAALTNDRECYEVVAGLIRVVHERGKVVVAEGVETSEQADVLRALDADFAQGFFFGAPAPPTRLESRLAQKFGSFEPADLLCCRR